MHNINTVDLGNIVLPYYRIVVADFFDPAAVTTSIGSFYFDTGAYWETGLSTATGGLMSSSVSNRLFYNIANGTLYWKFNSTITI